MTNWFQIVCNLVSVQQLWQVNLVCRNGAIKSGSNWPENEKTLATVSRDISTCVFTTLSCWKTFNKQDKLEYDPSFSYSKMYIHGTCAEMHVKILRNQIWQLAIRELRRISIHTYPKILSQCVFFWFYPPFSQMFFPNVFGLNLASLEFQLPWRFYIWPEHTSSFLTNNR